MDAPLVIANEVHAFTVRWGLPPADAEPKREPLVLLVLEEHCPGVDGFPPTHNKTQWVMTPDIADKLIEALQFQLSSPPESL